MIDAPEPPPGPRNLGLAITNRPTLRGFIIFDHMNRYPGAETLVEARNAPQAFLDLLNGGSTGKMMVRL